MFCEKQPVKPAPLSPRTSSADRLRRASHNTGLSPKPKSCPAPTDELHTHFRHVARGPRAARPPEPQPDLLGFLAAESQCPPPSPYLPRNCPCDWDTVGNPGGGCPVPGGCLAAPLGEAHAVLQPPPQLWPPHVGDTLLQGTWSPMLSTPRVACGPWVPGLRGQHSRHHSNCVQGRGGVL